MIYGKNLIKGELLNLYEHGKISTGYLINRMTFISINQQNINNEKINETKLNQLLKELDMLVGLSAIKKLVKEIQAYSTIQKKRISENLSAESLVLHMILKGNPGTGKTTVARLLGKILYEMRILEKGHMIEVERADLVGEYIGHTALRVRDQLKKAQGGILFIDEAYSLARGGEKDFGKEAIDALVKGMEDYKDKFILILAGYKDEMDHFISINPGLKSRIPIHMDFPDYDLEELISIAESIVDKRQYKLSISAKAKLAKIISQKKLKDNLHNGNARLVRNIIEMAIRKQAIRLLKYKSFSREDLITIISDDIVEEEDTWKNVL